MSTYIDCVVDTEPMAREISHVSHHIQGTTAAVVGMKAAILQAEEEAANLVCENVNRGFYALIHSQISQKMAKLQSDVDSRLMQLHQQQKQLHAIKDRMGRDYNMICARYVKLFNGLNQNLEQRVFELDKPTIEFAVKEVGQVSNRSKMLPALVPISQLESLELSQKIIASNLKYRGLEVIESMKTFLQQMADQQVLTRKILLPKDLHTPSAQRAIPVIISESNSEIAQIPHFDVVVTEIGINERAQQQITNTVSNSVGQLEWQPIGTTEQVEVQSEFNKYLQHADVSDRVKQTMGRLFAQSSYQSIK